MAIKIAKLSCIFLNEASYNGATAAYYWKLKTNSLINSGSNKPKNNANQTISDGSIIYLDNTTTPSPVYSDIIKYEDSYEGSLIFEKITLNSSSCGELYKLELLPDIGLTISNPAIALCSTQNTGSITNSSLTGSSVTTTGVGSTSTQPYTINSTTPSGSSITNWATKTVTGTTSTTVNLTSITYTPNITTSDKVETITYSAGYNLVSTGSCITPDTCSPSTQTFNVTIYPYISAGENKTTTICYNSATEYDFHQGSLFFGNPSLNNSSSAYFGNSAILTNTPRVKVIYSYETSTSAAGTPSPLYGSPITIGEFNSSTCSSTTQSPCKYKFTNLTGVNFIRITRKVEYYNSTNSSVVCSDTKTTVLNVTYSNSSNTPITVTVCNN